MRQTECFRTVYFPSKTFFFPLWLLQPKTNKFNMFIVAETPINDGSTFPFQALFTRTDTELILNSVRRTFRTAIYGVTEIQAEILDEWVPHPFCPNFGPSPLTQCKTLTGRISVQISVSVRVNTASLFVGTFKLNGHKALLYGWLSGNIRSYLAHWS